MPTKVAHQEMNMPTTAMKRPQLHELIKEAVAGTVSKVDIDAEAERQLTNMGVLPQGRMKTAAARLPVDERIPTEYIDKLAGALDYAASMLVKEADVAETSIKPGVGPNTLEVSEAPSGENPIQPGNQGQATSKNVPPMTPPMQSSGVAKDPSNAMATNDDMMHGEQPVEPIANEKTSSIYQRNLAVFGLQKVAQSAADILAQREAAGRLGGGSAGALLGGISGARRMAALGQKHPLLGPVATPVLAGISGAGLGAFGGGALGGAIGGSVGRTLGSVKAVQNDPEVQALLAAEQAKQGSAQSIYARNLAVFGLQKVAEDAINPAQISAGPAEATGADAPKDASPAEEQVPPEPSDVNKQKALISSNQAAIDYTRAQAKADPKSDMADVVTEPALSASTDKTLDLLFSKTREAGAKIASDLTRTAAAQALLAKHAAEARARVEAKKEKQSQMSNPQLSTPSGQSGFRSDSTTGQGM